jgi:hypothetical protein
MCLGLGRNDLFDPLCMQIVVLSDGDKNYFG